MLKSFYSRYGMSRSEAVELFIASFFINILALAVPLYVIQVLSRYLANAVDRTLVTLSLGVIIAVSFEGTFRMLRSRLAANISSNTHEMLARKAFRALVNIKSQALAQIPFSARHSIMRSLGLIQNAYSANNLTIALDVPFSFLFVIVLGLLSPVLAGIVTLSILASFISIHFGLRQSKQAAPKINKSQMNRNSLVDAVIKNTNTVKAYNAGALIIKKWEQINEDWQALQINNNRRQAMMQNINHAITLVTIILTIGVGAKLVTTGKLNIGSLIGANILATRAILSASRLIYLLDNIAQAEHAEKRLKQFLKFPQEEAKGKTLKAYQGNLMLQDIGFIYPGNKNPSFERLNLTIKPGEIIGITGPNSSGKTTLVYLLIGLLEPSRGNILIDGINIQQINMQWWRRQIGYLSQEVSLFNASIGENIKVANSKLTAKELDDIINLTGLRQFINNSPKGLDTILVDDTQQLSVGIKHCIGLARALATNGKLMILDEPTASQDEHATQAVYRVIDQLIQQKKNLIIITNESDILSKANYIIDLSSNPVPKVSKVTAKSNSIVSGVEP